MIKRLWPELLICALAAAVLAMTCYSHHRMQERLNELERITIPAYPAPPVEFAPAEGQK